LSVAGRSALDELWDARHSLSDQEERRRAADDVVWRMLNRRYSEHEYLSAQLEVAHAHMVGRDLAEQAVMSIIDAPRAPKRDADEVRRLFGDVLSEYGWHRGALERTIAWVRDRQEEAARRDRRAASPGLRPQPTVASAHTARSSARSLA
jgi:hypothetical protein